MTAKMPKQGSKAIDEKIFSTCVDIDFMALSSTDLIQTKVDLYNEKVLVGQALISYCWESNE
jgi:hypothetical protein